MSPLPIAVTVALVDAPEITVAESVGVVRICISLSPATARDVIVNIATTIGSASKYPTSIPHILMTLSHTHSRPK